MINFDDDRALAAIKVLVEFSERTQELLFTHHQRIVDLVKQGPLAGAFAVHRR